MDSNEITMNFEATKLFPGATMQIQAFDDPSTSRHEVKFIGFIKDKSLLVTLPHQDGQDMWMRAGRTYVIRGFNGIHAYAFSTQVIRARAHPYSYIHFSWPKKVECQLVRHSLRISITLPAIITMPDGSSKNVTMVDLSISGSMLDAPFELGAVDDRFKIEFTLTFEESTVSMNLLAIIRNSKQKEDGTGFQIEIAFEKTTYNDGLILHHLINSQAQKNTVLVQMGGSKP